MLDSIWLAKFAYIKQDCPKEENKALESINARSSHAQIKKEQENKKEGMIQVLKNWKIGSIKKV